VRYGIRSCHFTHRDMEDNQPTVTLWEREVPVSVGAMLAREHRVAKQDVPRVALEGDGLPHAVVRVDHVPVLERGRVWAVL
jgi:hypothetical protein